MMPRLFYVKRVFFLYQKSYPKVVYRHFRNCLERVQPKRPNRQRWENGAVVMCGKRKKSMIDPLIWLIAIFGWMYLLPVNQKLLEKKVIIRVPALVNKKANSIGLREIALRSVVASAEMLMNRLFCGMPPFR